jgi:hypothetical protein
MKKHCIYCGNDLDSAGCCILCGPQPNVTCPKCGEEYFATGLGVCPICLFEWDEPFDKILPRPGA